MSQAVNSPSHPLFHLRFLQMRFQILLPYSLFGLALLRLGLWEKGEVLIHGLCRRGDLNSSIIYPTKL